MSVDLETEVASKCVTTLLVDICARVERALKEDQIIPTDVKVSFPTDENILIFWYSFTFDVICTVWFRNDPLYYIAGACVYLNMLSISV